MYALLATCVCVSLSSKVTIVAVRPLEPLRVGDLDWPVVGALGGAPEDAFCKKVFINYFEAPPWSYLN